MDVNVDDESNSQLFTLVSFYILSILLSMLVLIWIYEICVWIYLSLVHLHKLLYGNAETNTIVENSSPDDDFYVQQRRKEIIKKLPCEKKKSSAVDGGNVVICAICLEEVVSGEMCRVLPICEHVYHVGCIDCWLIHHQLSCPICRCSLVEYLLWKFLVNFCIVVVSVLFKDRLIYLCYSLTWIWGLDSDWFIW